MFRSLLLNCCDEEPKARLFAARFKNAPPISSLGLRMSNNTVWIAIGLRVGAAIYQPHDCASCGKQVGKLGYHGLSCTSSQGWTIWHNSLNNIIYCSLASAKLPSRLEPPGLHHANGICPDGVSMIPWSEGRFLVWDATCVNPFCQSYKQQCVGRQVQQLHTQRRRR